MPKAFLTAIVLATTAHAAYAQGFIRKDSHLPDASSFYMARQQWRIEDNSPIINGQPGMPMQQQGQGGMQGGPPALPKAGWQPYSQQIPGLSTNLPKVNNGVPPKLPPQPQPLGTGQSAKAGKLGPAASKPKPAQTPAASIPPAIRSYTPYKGYNPNPEPAPIMGNSGMNTNSNVKGSVLHWARGRRNY